ERPADEMRVVVGTRDAVAVGFNVPVAELLTARALARHRQLRALGPDLLSGTGVSRSADREPFDRLEVIRRLRARRGDTIGDALLNQRVVAGIGNVFKSEILFVARIDPFAPVSSLNDAELDRLVAVARELLQANVMGPAQHPRPAIGRRPTRRLR